MLVSCVAVIGATNSPLYLRTFREEEDLGLHYIAHVALDIVEEKLRSAGIMGSRDDMYLGFLGPIEDYRVYGYATNTSVKFILILQDAPTRDSELRAFFAELHKMYVNAMSNPFAAIGERLTSPGFDKKVQTLVQQQSIPAPKESETPNHFHHHCIRSKVDESALAKLPWGLGPLSQQYTSVMLYVNEFGSNHREKSNVIGVQPCKLKAEISTKVLESILERA